MSDIKLKISPKSVLGSDSYNFPKFEINKLHTSTTKKNGASLKESGTNQLTVRICHGISQNSEQDVAMATLS